MDLKNKIRQIIKEELSKSDSTKYISWENLDSETQTDIISNIYHNSPYLEKEWNIWTFKEYVDGATDIPKFKIQYKSVDGLYNQMERRGWGISDKQLNNLNINN